MTPTRTNWAQHIEDIANTYGLDGLTQENITRCGHCKWTTTGPLVVTRDAFKAHIKAKHPDVKIAKRAKRPTGRAVLMNGKTLEQAIADARAQGAHHIPNDR